MFIHLYSNVVDDPAVGNDHQYGHSAGAIETENQDDENIVALNVMDKDLALKNLDESFDILRKLILSSDADRDALAGVGKFRERLGKLSSRQAVSALHKFGSAEYLKKIQSKAKSIVKRAERQHIGVQPAAVQRRRSGNGSRRREVVGSSCPPKATMCAIPEPLPGKKKRGHVLGDNIGNNVPSAKKHSTSMKSLSRPTYKKKTQQKSQKDTNTI